MKQKILVIGITMNCAGTEKSFLSFASALDYGKYDVDLLLAKKEGLFLSLLPPQIRIIEMEEYGDMFQLSSGNAVKTIWNCFGKKNPLVLFEVFPYLLKILLNKKSRSKTATRLWCRLLQKVPSVKENYDIAVAYWGDRSMFYMVDKVSAKKKIAWLHFDYGNPPRDDKTYLNYFLKCDRVVTVSSVIDQSLRSHLPQIADRCVLMENINNPQLVRDMAGHGDSFTDHSFAGKRILTVGRISEQKGYDMAVEALALLCRDGFDVKWYILGGGEEQDIRVLRDQAATLNVEDRLVFLGTTVNPYPYIKDCDLYVQPSRHEGKPIAVEEAKILSKPIVVTNYLSAHEQLKNGLFGEICEISSEGIYRSCKHLLENSTLREAFMEELSRHTFGNSEEIQKFYQMVKYDSRESKS